MELLYEQDVGSFEDEPLLIEDYQHVACRDFVVNLGDWIFRVPPFAETSAIDDQYLEYVLSAGISQRAVTKAVQMKQFVPKFLDLALDEVLAANPKIVGFSSVFQQNVASLVLAKMIKTRKPEITVVFGGGNCDGPMGAALHKCFPWVDVVVRGEGERTFVEVVSDTLAARQLRPQPGLCYRDGGEQIVVPQADTPQVPMDEVPTPIYDGYFERLERSPLRGDLWSEVAILFESSRGCWWGAKSHCTFCGLNGSLMMFRSKPVDRVLDEITGLAKKYKILDFVAVDDIIDLAHIRDLMPRLSNEGYDLHIFYETKANLKKEHLRAFRAGGVSAIQPGIESLSTPILQLMRKGVSALQNIRLLKWCAEIGITPSWNILYGFPGEPASEYERMASLLPFLVHLEAPNFMPVAIERFSPYFDRSEDFGLELTGPLPQYRYLYDVPAACLSDLAYEFAHRYRDGRDPEQYTQSLRSAVERWQQLGSAAAGTLEYRRGPDFLTIEDRRPGLEPADFLFEGVEAQLYLACDSGATSDQLVALLGDNSAEQLTGIEIEEFLDELVAHGLVYRERNLFLSLATAANSGLNRVAAKEQLDESVASISA